MKILVVGAGPAGLMFASEMKKHQSNWQIDIIEKNTPEDILGWGVVLPGRPPNHPANPLSYISNPETLCPQYHENFHFIHNNELITAPTGVTLCGVERRALVRSLRDHCESLGININYLSAVYSEEELQKSQADLVVISNGVNIKNNHFCNELSPEIDYGKNKYIWYGTSRLFDSMHLIFRQHNNENFIAHAYRYSNDMSTFVVECSEQTYQKFHLNSCTNQDSIDLIKEVFHQDLQDHNLVAQEGLGWRNFMTLSHQNAKIGNCALLGDALQSGHFSIGHGTTMAVVAAQTLVKSLAQIDPNLPPSQIVTTALDHYQEKVMPLMTLFRKHANISRLWFESIDTRMTMQANELATSFKERRTPLPPLPPALGKAFQEALQR